MRLSVTAIAVMAAVGVTVAGCSTALPRTDVAAVVQQRQAERLQRLAERHAERDGVLASIATQRQRALDELHRIEHVGGRITGVQSTRYGSDGTGDPTPWVQSGARATKAPTSTALTIAHFEQANAHGRIQLIGAATVDEVRRGLIDDRVLGVLLALSERHRLQVNSLRVSHPRDVQDDLGTPTDSNHVFGRAADISAVDGVPCSRETRRAPYRTILDNPPPARPGPCLALADEASQLDGELAAGEIIFYWRVPGLSGVSMPNHDDHLHLGYRTTQRDD